MVTLYEYTASKNPRGAVEVINSYGIRPQRHPKILAKQLAECVRRDGENALMKIADIHPDLPLFQGKLDSFKAKYKEESHSNACGCSNFSNANGQTIKDDVAAMREDSKSSNDKMIMAGVILLGLALILKR